MYPNQSLDEVVIVGKRPMQFLNGEQENTEAYTYADHILSRNEHMDAKIKNYMGNALVKFKPNKRLEIGVLLDGGYEMSDFQLAKNTSNKYVFLSLSANDIFKQNKPSSKRYYQDYKMTNVTDSHIRSINLSVSWKFGKTSVNGVDKQTRDMLNGRDSK